MTIDSRVRLLMDRLDFPPFTIVTSFCGNDTFPGRDEIPEFQIYAERETTPDQARIEECLEEMVYKSASIFHVGVGNSSLARKFSHRVKIIEGITLHSEEKSTADSLNIQNYNVTLVNKYSNKMNTYRNYDFIIDNNPSSFACCLYHFCQMMTTYYCMLRADGTLLTDELGLDCVVTNGDPAWSLCWADWVRLGQALNMPARRLTATVYSLLRASG